MLSKSVFFAFALVFAIALNASADHPYGKELAQKSQQLEDLDAKIAQTKQQISDVIEGYKQADLALRQSLIKREKELTDTQGPDYAHGVIVTEGKEKQAALRADYYSKKKPLAKKLYALKEEQVLIKRSVKKMQHQIDRIGEGKFVNFALEEKIKGLKVQISALDDEYLQQKHDLKKDIEGKVGTLAKSIGEKKARKRIDDEYVQKKQI